MSPATELIYQAALQLPESERAVLIEALIAAADAEQGPPLDESWRAILQRRSAEIDAGSVDLIPWAEVRERARKRIGLDD